MKKYLIPLFTLTALVLLSGCGAETETQSSDETVQSTSETVETLPYEIYSVEEDVNTTYGTKYGGKTYQVYIIVKEQATVDELKDICQTAAEEVQKNYSAEVDAIMVFPYDYPEYIGHGFVLGKAVMMSDGSWEWDLQEKDWSQQLTPEEVNVWVAWQDLIQQKHEENPDGRVDEEAVTSEISEQFGITPEKVDEIVMKQAMWSL